MFIIHKFDILKSDSGMVASYNTTIKKYLNGTKKIAYHSYNSFKGLPKLFNGVGGSTEEEKERYKYINLLRCKEKIQDYAYNNGTWQYFVTLTFDKDVVGDREDYSNVCSYLIKWLNNQKHQNIDMEYLAVCEVHKKGGYHFHLLVKNVPNWKLKVAINPHTGKIIRQNGSVIYNLTNYKLGLTTVSEVKNQEAVTVYIGKYITKDLLDIKNKKHYWVSKSLVLPEYEYCNTSEEELKEYIKDYDVTYENKNEQENFTNIYYTLKDRT